MLTVESNRIITLIDEEWGWAVDMGTKRHQMAEGRGYLQTDHSRSPNGLANHIRGAGGEIATAKYYEIRWDATYNTFRRVPDLRGCEIRSTAEDNPYLRVKMTDTEKKLWPFILTTCLGDRRYRIEGYLYGYEAMRDKYYVAAERHSRQQEWCVPICDLDEPFALQSILLSQRDLRKPVARQEPPKGAARAI